MNIRDDALFLFFTVLCVENSENALFGDFDELQFGKNRTRNLHQSCAVMRTQLCEIYFS